MYKCFFYRASVNEIKRSCKCTIKIFYHCWSIFKHFSKCVFTTKFLLRDFNFLDLSLFNIYSFFLISERFLFLMQLVFKGLLLIYFMKFEHFDQPPFRCFFSKALLIKRLMKCFFSQCDAIIHHFDVTNTNFIGRIKSDKFV